MRCTRTLETSQSVLQIFEAPGYVEYRVYERRRAPTTSGMTLAWAWRDAILLLFFAIIYGSKLVHGHLQAPLTLLGLLYMYRRLTGVRYESLILLPHLGLQLETHYGPVIKSLFVARQFIPLGTLHDVVINEGLMGWNCRYYTTVLTRTEAAPFALVTVFPNILPHAKTLFEVLEGTQIVLLEENL